MWQRFAKKIPFLFAMALVAWFFAERASRSPSAPPAKHATAVGFVNESGLDSPESRFSCDGRTHCSQMTSCAEAEYFLQNCPGVKMDGNNDGEPCEGQWCGR